MITAGELIGTSGRHAPRHRISIPLVVGKALEELAVKNGTSMTVEGLRLIQEGLIRDGQPEGVVMPAGPTPLRCLRCGGEWLMRKKDGLPKTCRHCRSPYWNRPRGLKVKKVENGHAQQT